jgi:DNA-binding NarL/FixJ family response regulator
MTNEERIRVMIVEDHFMVRVGLVAIINSQTDMVVVAEAKNGLEAIDLYGQHNPDVTLMDLRIPGVDGVAAILEIVRRYPEARIIVISTYGGEEDIFRAMQAGARGYYLKHVEGQELVAAIRAVHAGETRLPAEVAARFEARARRVELSPRETEVFQLMAKGMSNKEIATALFISEGTVRVHVSHVLLKLGYSDRVQAVSEAFQRGLIRATEEPADRHSLPRAARKDGLDRS